MRGEHLWATGVDVGDRRAQAKVRLDREGTQRREAISFIDFGRPHVRIAQGGRFVGDDREFSEVEILEGNGKGPTLLHGPGL